MTALPLPDSLLETDRRWLRWQAISGTVFALFLLVHLINQMISVLGAARYDAAQDAFRAGYQFPLLEVGVVVAPLIVHVVTVVRRFFLRRAITPTHAAPSLRVRLHRWSGRFLLVFVFGHFAATRGTDLLFGTPPRFEGVAWSFQWMPLYFWPYYTLLGLAGWYHLVHGLGTAGGLLQVRWLAALSRPLVFRTVVGLGATALLLAVLSFGGVLRDVGHPETSAFAKSVLQVLKR